MVAITAGLAIGLNDTDEGTTPTGFRRALAPLFAGTTPGQATAGRLGADNLAVFGHATAMQYRVTGGGVVLVRTAANGVYLVGVPEEVILTAPPANGVNPRIDRIYAYQPDPELDGPATDVDFIIDVASGLAAASPVAPAIPAGALELARKRVGAGVLNTLDGLAFTNIAPVTSLRSGTIDISEVTRGGAPFDPDLKVVHKQSGAALTSITIPATGTGALIVKTGMNHFWTSTAFGNEYAPKVEFDVAFPTACLSVQITELHISSAVAHGRAAIDNVSKTQFRVVYPSSGSAAERAYMWTAVGY